MRQPLAVTWMQTERVLFVMPKIHSFAPIATTHAHTLILGSMPGKASLQQGQYYAHPRNAFWRIIAALFNFDIQIGYEKRVAILTAHHIALWDVLKTCTRDSSLDSDIIRSSIVVNDFQALFEKHTAIKYIFFNGTMAKTTFERQVVKKLGPYLKQLHLQCLPSTSPANAVLSYQQKLQVWRCIKERRKDK